MHTVSIFPHGSTSITFPPGNFVEDKQYVAFGLSGAEKRTRMVGGDVVVAWMEHETGKGFANDYYLEAKGQCAGQSGACPDEVFEASHEDSTLTEIKTTGLVHFS